MRIVVKIGSKVLCDPSGALNKAVLGSLAEQAADLEKSGSEVLLVSSGAVAAGQGLVNEHSCPGDPVKRRQVLAAAGQVRLMQTWQSLFAGHGLTIAQVLASKSDFQTRSHYLNMRQCIEGILEANMIPVINENDTVSVTELMFTDNDELAGLIASMVNADLLYLLSSVPGVLDDRGEVISQWDEHRHDAEALVNAGANALGRGGMHSKISTARKISALGTRVIIADGRAPGVLQPGEAETHPGTLFRAAAGATPAKRWLASADDHATGAVLVNQGAADALQDDSRLTSLLPVGIVKLEGQFQRGDVIRIIDPSGNMIGCGRAQYDHAEAQQVVGVKGEKPVIHYDYLYLVR
ncbi:MAG: glutamate 5-kinase [Gammaproteobacteria bacterium]|nr:glutamate 5-kinase [Gammaproteobacteria bacterium]